MTIHVALKKRNGIFIKKFDIPAGMGDAEMEIMIQDKLAEDEEFYRARLMGWNEDGEELREYMKQKYGRFFKG